MTSRDSTATWIIGSDNTVIDRGVESRFHCDSIVMLRGNMQPVSALISVSSLSSGPD